MTTPSGRISNELERERKREKKMPFIVATYVSACSPRAAHALRSDQNVSAFSPRAAHALRSDQ